ncbi:MAG TPA: alkaline phosphatase family protein [Candidatus Baltobacteraceae bacterium]|nr:alkaline phosphatase family protein [Candidatus Baltobacteraceae bacterium]
MQTATRSVPSVPAPKASHHKTGLTFKITVPARRPGARGLYYVSQSSQSLAISIDGGSPSAFNLSPSAPNCSAGPPLTCTIVEAAPIGSDSVTIWVYDQPNATGNVLSQNTVLVTVAAGQLNQIPIALNGVVASLSLALVSSSPLPQSSPATVPLSVNAYDADGNLIVGPGAYAQPVTVVDSDQSGGTTLSVTENGVTKNEGSAATLPDSTGTVSVNYNGQPLSAAVFSAASGAVRTNPAQNATLSFAGGITHVIIVFQENRTTDNIFNGFPGADTAQSGQTSGGQTIPLQPVRMVENYDPGHFHASFTTEYNNGAMNGFDKEFIGCGAPCSPSPPPDAVYAYVVQSDVQPYWTMAQSYAFADRMFQTNQGPSFPSHMYMISGTAASDATNTLYAKDNPFAQGGSQTYNNAGCDAPSAALVAMINPITNDQTQARYPCFDHTTLMDTLDRAGLSWKYYQAKLGQGLWYAVDAIRHLRYGPDYANVSVPSTNVINDISNGTLPAVSWVMPSGLQSDHPAETDGSGPAWVASIVNAVGNSRYWSNTAILITWDDWGGWYDHVAPPLYNYYELGFRVPLIVVSPYAKAGYVSHVTHEYGSLLRFTEETLGLATLGYTDARSDDLSEMFNFSQPPLSFQSIPAAKVKLKDELAGPTDDY